MLLPAADYNVYRGGTRLPTGDGARPPIGASPGELRLWMKLQGELDKDKVAEETRVHARNGNRGARRSLEATGLIAVASHGLVKSGRRAGQKAALLETTNQQGGKGTIACVECVQLRQQGGERAAALKASESRVAGLEARLKALALELAAAQDEGERQASAVAELESRLAAATRGEKERTAGLAQRIEQLTQTVAEQQAQLAAGPAGYPPSAKAEHGGHGGAPGAPPPAYPPCAPLALPQSAAGPPALAASAEAQVEAEGEAEDEAGDESYSEDEDQ